MYTSARCESLIKACLGVRFTSVNVGALQYTMLVFGFSFLWVLARIKKDKMQLYLIDITLYYNCLPLILQYL